MIGTEGADRISGGDGADHVIGMGGDDCLAGGGQADTIVPGAGEDLAVARRGDDRIEASDGHPDDVRCGPGHDTVVADAFDELGGCERVTWQSTDPTPEPPPRGDPPPPPPPPPPASCDRDATPSSLATQVSAATGGQVICLAGGNYGTWTGTNKAVTITKAAGATPTMRYNFGAGDSGFTLDGLSGMGGTINTGAHDITIRNSAFNDYALFENVANANILFDHNTHIGINSPAGAPNARIFLWNTGGPTGVTIRNSLLRGGDSDGVHTDAAVDVINNEFDNLCDAGGNHTDHIQFQGAQGGVIRGNYFHSTCAAQTLTSFDSGTHNVLIEDNVIDTHRPYGIEWYSDDSSIIRHNTIVYHPDSDCAFTGVVCGGINITSKTADPPGYGTQVYDNIAFVDIDRATVGRNDHNISGQSVTYVGPTTTYAGHRLAASSVGADAGSDGLDVGIR